MCPTEADLGLSGCVVARAAVRSLAEPNDVVQVTSSLQEQRPTRVISAMSVLMTSL